MAGRSVTSWAIRSFWALGECAGVLLAGLVVGGLGVVERAQRGVPVRFEGVGDEPVGGVDGQVAAAGQVGVVAGALDVGGAQRVGFGGAVLEFGGDGERGLDGQRGEGVQEQLPDGLVQAGAGDGGADRPGVLDAVALAQVGRASRCRGGGGSGRSSGCRSLPQMMMPCTSAAPSRGGPAARSRPCAAALAASLAMLASYWSRVM